MSQKSRNRKRIELELYRQLDEIYARIPEVACKGLCQRFCTTVMVSLAEQYRISKATANPHDFNRQAREVMHGVKPAEPCPHLATDTGRCKVYAIRPFVCRAFGAAETFDCPHGCEVKGNLLPDSEARAMLRDIKAIEVPEPLT